MTLSNMRKYLLLFFIPLILAACAVFQANYSPPSEHPDPLHAGRPQCTDCHDSADENFPYLKFNHDIFFMENHRSQALSGKATCDMCHKDSFCTECHGIRLELKPSLRKPFNPGRRMPHRGDFLSRHRIEGRINPASCFKCHGSAETAERCIKCHGR